jgi:hypothetical protein
MATDPRIEKELDITLKVHGGAVFCTTDDGGGVPGR